MVLLRRVLISLLAALPLGAAAASAAIVSEPTHCSIDLRARNGNTGCVLAVAGGAVQLDGSFETGVRALGGVRTSFEYDSVGRLVRSSSDGAATAYEYDLAGRLVRRADAAGAVTRYEYDAAGRLVSAGDTRLAYSDAGLVAAALPDGRIVRYTYDARGNLVRSGDDSEVTSYTYDDHRRLTGVSSVGSTTAYSYDEAGRVVRRDVNGAATAYSYDKRALVSSLGPDGNVVHYTYDADGSMLSAGSSAAQVRVAYDQTGRFVAIQGLDGELTVVEYDAEGRPLLVAPEPGDEVLVQFAHGDVGEPYVVGFTWSDDDGPSYTLTPRGRLLACSVCP